MRSVRQLFFIILLFVLFSVLTTGCSVPGAITPTSPTTPVVPPSQPSQELPEVVYQGWDAAKGRLYDKGFDCVVGREPISVKWVLVDGTFDCGGVESNGCFWKDSDGPPMIQLNTEVLSVDLVAHESSHYLLWACKSPGWACYLWERDNYAHLGCVDGQPAASQYPCSDQKPVTQCQLQDMMERVYLAINESQRDMLAWAKLEERVKDLEARVKELEGE